MKPLALIWLALMILLALTVAFSRLNVPFSANLAAALTISALKTALVVFFFMELRHSLWALRLAAAAAVFMFGVLLAGTLNDYFSRRRDAQAVAPRQSGPDRPDPLEAGVTLPDDSFR